MLLLSYVRRRVHMLRGGEGVVLVLLLCYEEMTQRDCALQGCRQQCEVCMCVIVCVLQLSLTTDFAPVNQVNACPAYGATVLDILKLMAFHKHSTVCVCVCVCACVCVRARVFACLCECKGGVGGERKTTTMRCIPPTYPNYWPSIQHVIYLGARNNS